MSIRVMDAVFRGSLAKGSARLVLLALADVASDDGEVTAYRRSHAVLIRKAAVSRAAVKRSIAALEELGELEVLRSGTGRQSTNYRIQLAVLLASESTADESFADEGAQGDTPQDRSGGSPVDPRGIRMSPQGSHGDTPIIPSLSVVPPSANEQLPLVRDLAASHRRPPPPSRFDEFWTEYPLHKSKGAAERAWTKALKKASAEVLIAGAVAYRNDAKRQRSPEWTRYPATWLNDKGWLDEPTPHPSDAVIEH